LYERGDDREIGAAFREKVRRILTALDNARVPEDMNLSGLGLHALRGDLKGFWSVTVSRNWRIVFRLDDGSVHDVDLIDYH
jgi:proteic killer suppression protein